jgi:hypothetical protein
MLPWIRRQFLAPDALRLTETLAKISLAFAFVALLPVCGIAQSSGSAQIPAKANANVAALSKKALAGDTLAQLQLGTARNRSTGRNLLSLLAVLKVIDLHFPLAKLKINLLHISAKSVPSAARFSHV